MSDQKQAITAVSVPYRYQNGKPYICVFRRAETKAFLPGKWELIGGHIDYGESLEDGLRREVREEIGQSCEVEDVFAAFTYINEVKKTHSVELVYLVKLEDDDHITLNPEDHSEYVWVEKSDIDSIIVPVNGADDQELPVLYKAFEVLSKK